MGMEYGAICNRCGRGFRVSEGPGMLSGVLHCDRCGREKWVKHPWIKSKQATQKNEVSSASDGPRRLMCQCGGMFTEEAKARCPYCRSDDWQNDPNSPMAMYD